MDERCESEYENGYLTHRYFDLGKHSKAQNVLLIRTGHESGLSAPIDFGKLRDQCLPLRRPDFDRPRSNDWVIRVSLATAIKYISDLEQREYAAFPGLCVGTGPGNLSYASAEAAEVHMNWTFEESSKTNKYASMPWRLKEATEAVMNGIPYTEQRGYMRAKRSWGLRFFEYQRRLRADSLTEYEEVWEMKKRKRMVLDDR